MYTHRYVYNNFSVLPSSQFFPFAVFLNSSSKTFLLSSHLPHLHYPPFSACDLISRGNRGLLNTTVTFSLLSYRNTKKPKPDL